MANLMQNETAEIESRSVVEEDSAAWAERMTSGLNGLLRDEIKAFGGADALMKWIRSDDEDDEA